MSKSGPIRQTELNALLDFDKVMRELREEVAKFTKRTAVVIEASGMNVDDKIRIRAEQLTTNLQRLFNADDDLTTTIVLGNALICMLDRLRRNMVAYVDEKEIE